jgi:hypothetical protein
MDARAFLFPGVAKADVSHCRLLERAFVKSTGSQAAMEGGGFYNRNSAVQAGGIALLSPIWLEACETVDLGHGPVRNLDLASSQGRNSMAPMAIAILAVRRRRGDALAGGPPPGYPGIF